MVVNTARLPISCMTFPNGILALTLPALRVLVKKCGHCQKATKNPQQFGDRREDSVTALLLPFRPSSLVISQGDYKFHVCWCNECRLSAL